MVSRKRGLAILIAIGIAMSILFYLWAGRADVPAGLAPHPGVNAHLQHVLTGHSGEVWQAAFSPDGSYLASCGVDRSIRLWRLPDGVLVGTLTQPMGITCLAFSPDGRFLAAGSYDQKVRVWRMQDRAVERTLSGHEGTVWSVAFSPDGQTLASSGEDRTIRLWRVSDGAPLETLLGHTLNVWSVDFSPDGRWLASGSFDKTAKLWRAQTGELVRTLSGHSQAIVKLAFSPDSTLLATGSDDSSVRLWRTSDGGLSNTLAGGSQHVYAVAFSPDGRWLASGSRERSAIGTFWRQLAGDRWSAGRKSTVRLWQVTDGVLQQALAEHSGDVHSVAFSPDGRWLATSGDDGLVRVWALETAAQRNPSAM